MIKLDNLDYACVGVVTINNIPHLVYSEDRIINQLMDEDGMSYDDARDDYWYNIARTVDYLTATYPAHPVVLQDRPADTSLDDFADTFSFDGEDN